VMRNGIYFIVIAFCVAELFKVLVRADWMTCGVAMWTRNGVKWQNMEYLYKY